MFSFSPIVGSHTTEVFFYENGFSPRFPLIETKSYNLFSQNTTTTRKFSKHAQKQRLYKKEQWVN
jgi:hypothetical protein